jgi:hypothetical protein
MPTATATRRAPAKTSKARATSTTKAPAKTRAKATTKAPPKATPKTRAKTAKAPVKAPPKAPAKAKAPARKTSAKTQARKRTSVTPIIPKDTEGGITFATLDEVQRFIATLPMEYIECRELRHAWERWHGRRENDGTITRVLRCPRCTTEKHQNLSRTGARLTSHYVYPEGYTNKGHGRIDEDGMNMIRLASLVDLLDEAV